MSGSLRQPLTTFAVVTVVMVLTHMALHARNGAFSITRGELIHQVIEAAVVSVALMFVGRK